MDVLDTCRDFLSDRPKIPLEVLKALLSHFREYCLHAPHISLDCVSCTATSKGSSRASDDAALDALSSCLHLVVLVYSTEIFGLGVLSNRIVIFERHPSISQTLLNLHQSFCLSSSHPVGPNGWSREPSFGQSHNQATPAPAGRNFSLRGSSSSPSDLHPSLEQNVSNVVQVTSVEIRPLLVKDVVLFTTFTRVLNLVGKLSSLMTYSVS